MSEGLIKKLAILLASLIVLFISVINSENILKPVTVFKEGTKIGSLDLSRVRWETGYATLQSKLNDPIYVHLDNQSRGVTLKEIGFDIDRDKLAKLTKTCKSGSFRLLCSNTSNERIDPNEVITINNWLLTKFLDEIQEEAQPLSENTIVSFIDNSFRAVVPGTEIEIDMSDFVDKKA